MMSHTLTVERSIRSAMSQVHPYLLRMRYVVAAVLIASTISFGASEVRADLVYSAAADFSTLSNPNGVWSYGWTQSLGSTYNLYSRSFQDATFERWDGDVVLPYGNFPYAEKNRTNQTIIDMTRQYSPGQLNLHPGPGGEYSVVRFVAPTNALYSISTTFGGMDFVGPTSTDVHILLNGNSIFNGNINGFGTGPSFSSLLNLQVGDRIDFAVGFGSNGHFNDSTSLDARLAAVPEPTSLLLLGSGVIGMFGLIRKKNLTRKCKAVSV